MEEGLDSKLEKVEEYFANIAAPVEEEVEEWLSENVVVESCFELP